MSNESRGEKMAKKMSQAEYNERENMLLLGFHWCSKCKQFLEIEYFSKSKSTEFGYFYWCKSCHSKSRKGKYIYKKKARQHNRELKSYYKSLMGGKCAKCGYNKTQVALEFHHVYPDKKEVTLSTLINTNKHDQIMFEIDKCILLCRNCHMELESYCWECEFVKSDSLGWKIKINTIIERKVEYWTKPSEKILYSQQLLLAEAK